MALVSTTDLAKTFRVPERKAGLKHSIKALFKPTMREIRAVDGLNLHIHDGEILGLIGPNGAGKSTTVKILTGILTPSAGTASVDGIEPYLNRQEVAKKIGVVFGQRSRLWWLLPVSESMEYFKAVYSIPDATFRRNLDYFSEVLGLDTLMDKPVRALSLGERMRVEISASLLHDPKLLYLDEPTVGLDVVGKNELRKLIQRINRDRGATVLLVTHDVIDIEKLCSRIIVIDKGTQIWEGTIAGLRRFHGMTKTVTIEYAQECAPVECDGVKLESQEGLRQTYVVDLGVIGIEEFVNLASAQGRFVDLQVSEQEIEEVIRKIYQS